MKLRSTFAALGLALSVGCGGKTAEPPSGTADAQVDVAEEVIGDAEPPVDGIAEVAPPPDAAPDTPPPPPSPKSKLDLLFVIDNSISMADKQGELAKRVPELVQALVTATPTTKAVASLHVGVITSSLGSHGTSACAPSIAGSHADDRGRLLPRAGEGGACPIPVTASPIRWAYDSSKGSAQFYGPSGATAMGSEVACVVQTVREGGCGYEETLEAMYHFLVDPAPYVKAEVSCVFGATGDACGSNKIVVSGVDTELLAQRAAFLRPDSSVAIVVLTDENDFSLKPAGLNWLPWGYGKGQMQRGWGACANVPDDFEPETAAEYSLLHSTYKCRSCFEDGSDPSCKVPWSSDGFNKDVDGRNLRGFQQVRRFGYNFLWGRQRYVDALRKPMVLGSDNKPGPNPLITSARGPGNILFAAIVGVPKQLVNGSDGLPKTLTAADWEKIASADPSKRDPHMIESIAPRPGLTKYAGDPSVDPVHGGERDIASGDDLQYACIGPRATDVASYDCEGPTPETRNPLCAAGGKQPRFKAYPGLRPLRVARDLGPTAMVASICDDSLSGPLKALVRRLQPLIE